MASFSAAGLSPFAAASSAATAANVEYVEADAVSRTT